MPGVIGVTVQDQVGQRTTMDNQRLGIVPKLGQFGERIGTLRQTGSLDVFHAPIGVQVVHVWADLWERGAMSKRHPLRGCSPPANPTTDWIGEWRFSATGGEPRLAVRGPSCK